MRAMKMSTGRGEGPKNWRGNGAAARASGIAKIPSGLAKSATDPESPVPHPGKGEKPGLVPAVERASRLLDLLAATERPQTLAELARTLELPKSSLHGLLHTLAALGLAMRDARGEYMLGPKALHWAQAFERQSNVIDAFNQASQAFEALREETIMLAVLDGAEVLYLACRPGSRALGVTFRVGGRFPACFTSSGKAMLATLPADRMQALLGDALPPPLTRYSVRDPSSLSCQLLEIGANGYAVDDEETAEGMQCFGAPVFAAGRSEAVAAVAVSLIKASTSRTRRAEVVAAIAELANDVSRRLGAASRRDEAQPAVRKEREARGSLRRTAA
jgi:DNA-binding IclR family transcriptional regulator